MNILLIGSGGREHALAWAISASPLCDRLFIAPGNPGTAECGDNVVLDIADHRAVADFCKLMGVGLVVVGPEGPLVEGIVDDLEAAGIKTFGPSKAAAQLEGSKAFTKELCAEFGIPTAGFARFTDEAAAKAYVAKTMARRS
jgi:phosphoribosylamine--glycine ligase